MSLIRNRTFTCMSVPKYTFWIGAIALNFMDGWGSPHAAGAASGEGVWQGGGGLVRLCLVQLVPGDFQGWVIKWFRADASLGRMVARTYEGTRVIGLSRTANALCGWRKALHGHRVLIFFGRIHHHGVWVLLWKRLLVGIHQAQGDLTEAKESAPSYQMRKKKSIYWLFFCTELTFKVQLYTHQTLKCIWH